MDLAGLSALISACYGASGDLMLWSALAQRIADAFGAESGSLQVRSLLPGGATRMIGITDNISAQAKAEYEAHYLHRDVYASHAMRHGLTGAWLSQHAVAPSEVMRTEFYTGWGRRSGIFHVVGGGVLLDPAQVALLAVHRPLGVANFTEQDRAHLALLLPHVARALQFAAQRGGLDMQRGASTAALDRLGVGVVLAGADASILWHNEIAEQLFRQGDALCAIGARLAARGRQDDLLRLLRECTGAAAPFAPPGACWRCRVRVARRCRRWWGAAPKAGRRPRRSSSMTRRS